MICDFDFRRTPISTSKENFVICAEAIIMQGGQEPEHGSVLGMVSLRDGIDEDMSSIYDNIFMVLDLYIL